MLTRSGLHHLEETRWYMTSLVAFVATTAHVAMEP